MNPFDAENSVNLGDKLKSIRNKAVVVLVVLLLLSFAKSAVYIVDEGWTGVILTLGKVTNTVEPGIHFKLPWPIQKLDKVDVKKVNRIELGFQTIDEGPPAKYRYFPEEASMLTGDENILEVTAAIQYVVSDPVTYLYRVDGNNLQKQLTLRKAAESALREIVGRYTIDDVLTMNKAMIQEETKRLLQTIADEFQLGVTIQQFKLQDVHPPDGAVQAAFSDVASAREDKQALINEAEAYKSDVIPKARGEAKQVVQEAEAEKESRILRAQGDVAKFEEMYKEYVNSKTVTRTRLYLEAMEEILAGKQIYIMNDDGNAVKLLPLADYVGGKGQ